MHYADVTNHERLRGAFQIEEGWKYVSAATPGGPEALFNVLDDPSETMDLQENFPDIFEAMKVQFADLANDIVERSRDHVDDITDGNGNISTGWC